MKVGEKLNFMLVKMEVIEFINIIFCLMNQQMQYFDIEN